MTSLPPDEPQGDDPQPAQPPATGADREQPTEEQFAVEADLPPEADSEDDIPELDPEFAAALREAAEASMGEQPAEEEPATKEPATEEPPAADEPIEEPEQATEEQPVPAVATGAGRKEVHEAIAYAAEAGQWAPPRLSAAGDPEPAPKRPHLWLRFALASLLIVASIAAATASSILLYLDDIAEALGHGGRLANLQRYLETVDGGEPQNILILGSDKRASDDPDSRGLSDTTMLLRLDPDNNAIALMSIPRDLKVNIPRYGVSKFNAAYSLGGPKLTLQVVKRLTHLPIHHLVNVDFLGFAKAVSAIDCVFIEVDRRYYHSNEGLAPEDQYAEINIRPGYQRLCGEAALEYVRYRHTDTDLVRAARQQDFLREARQRVPISKLVTDRKELIKIFTSYTTSDIDDVETMLQVIKLFIEARNAPIKEIHFPAVLGPSYVYASRSAINQAVDKFLGIEASGGPRGSIDRPDGEGRRDGPRGGGDRGEGRNPEEPSVPEPPAPSDDGLVEVGSETKDFAKRVARQVGPDFEVFYPTRLPSDAYFDDYGRNPRVYHLQDTDGNAHGAYRMVLAISLGGLPEYFGVQGIRGWGDPLILNNPSETKEIDGREYEIFLDGDRVRLIAWRDDGDTYWVSNTLLQSLTNDQMLGMARTIDSISPNPKPRNRRNRGR